MRFQKLLISAATAFCLVGASGPAQAQDQLPPEPTREIILDFCEATRNDAQETGQKLADAEEDRNHCVDEFFDCRDSGVIGEGDPLVDCLGDTLDCAADAANDSVEACTEFSEEFARDYERALREARHAMVENEFQEFFNTRGPARRICLRPSVRITRRCAQQEAPR